MFAKIFNQIYDSSIVENPETRFTFMDLLILADKNGVVDMTHEAIARRTNRPLELVKKTIVELEGPDPRSRTPDADGARIFRLDDHRDWGWGIVNYDHFRKLASEEQRRETTKLRMKKFRHNLEERNASYVYYAMVPGGTEVKIGFSKNPWARMRELQTSRPGISVVATEKGNIEVEKQRHSEFLALHIGGEWYHYKDKLKERIVTLIATVVTRSNAVERSGDDSPSASASASASEGGVRGGFKRPTNIELAKIITNEAEAQKFLDYYNSNGWKVGRVPMKDWQASARNWVRRNQPAQPAAGSWKRFNKEGRRVDEYGRTMDPNQIRQEDEYYEVIKPKYG